MTAYLGIDIGTSAVKAVLVDGDQAVLGEASAELATARPKDLWSEQDPQAWWREFGKGRTFYTALGHRDDLWSNDPVFRAHISGGIRWALGLE